MIKKVLIIAIITWLTSNMAFSAVTYAYPNDWPPDIAYYARNLFKPPTSVMTTLPSSANEEEKPAEEPGFVWQSGMVTDQPIAKREEGLEMKGVIPEMTVSFGSARSTVNDSINRLVEQKIAAAKEIKAKSISFEYSVYHSDSLISIILTSTITSASSKKEVDSINFDPVSGASVRANEATGIHITSLAEKLLTERIRRNPERYNAAFDGLPTDQTFYTTNNRVVFLFNEYQLAQDTEGIPKLEMKLSSISQITVAKNDYYAKPGYGLKMVPLRMICEDLGYEVFWEESEPQITIYRSGSLVMELTVGENNYLVRDKKVRSLEAAPDFKNNTVYVPISFFDQVLSLITYSVNDRDDITFLSYTE